ncbi:hypothetical protein QQX98_009139 [Neonectria punicea]|uniref:non-specific serine/threonine protein kinase n=1 Tax=Neonectria punicea TaxID=979145 RepID=A0ABR1GTI6_9HYPO
MSSTDQSDGLTEIVRDSRLPATFRCDGQQSYTIHSRPTVHWSRPNQEVWKHERDLVRGGFGLVELQSIETEPGRIQYRAVKSIDIADHQSKTKRSLYMRELEALVKFSHEKYDGFFIKFKGWYDSPGHIHIAMEYCELGDLQNYLYNSPNQRLPEGEIQEIAHQVLAALSQMHDEGFAHRDLKPAVGVHRPRNDIEPRSDIQTQNILIKSHPPKQWWVKVCDLGLSKRIGTITGTSSVAGTEAFMAPEMLNFNGDPKAANPYLSDMWSFGETISRALTGRPTFDSFAVLGKYCSGQTGFPTSALQHVKVSEDGIEFLGLVMLFDPRKRLNALNAKKHRWMGEKEQHVIRITQNSKDTGKW